MLIIVAAVAVVNSREKRSGLDQYYQHKSADFDGVYVNTPPRRMLSLLL